MLTVVIPTHQRRDRLLRALAALRDQDLDGEAYEVVVVVDGSSDGSASTVADIDWPFAVRVLEQRHRGLAAARNLGAREARGEDLLFLDDDMVCDTSFLKRVSDQLHDGADVALTRLQLGEWVNASPLARQYRKWLENVHSQLLRDELDVTNVVFGATGVRREVFVRVGGFDERFTAAGAYGSEDAELARRLQVAGARFAYVPEAIARTDCETDPRRHLARASDLGRNHVLMARLHPDMEETLFGRPFRGSRLHGAVGPVVRTFPLIAGLSAPLLRPLAVRAAGRLDRGPLARRLWYVAWSAEYWRGVTEAGGAPLVRGILPRSSRLRRPSLRVLAYHAVGAPDSHPVLGDYEVSVKQLEAHLDVLERLGFKWVDLDTALEFLEGRRRLPRRAVLLTFDDGYRGVLEQALPLLRDRAIPACVFVVTGRLGGTNDWEREHDGAPVPLLDAAGIQELVRSGVAVGSHSRTHTPLEGLDPDLVWEEVHGSAGDLQQLGVGRFLVFAYPQGRHDATVRAAVRRAGYRAGFTVEAGGAHPGGDVTRVPRIEVHRQDVGFRFLAKVLTSGRSPYWEAAMRRRLGFLRPVVRGLRSISGSKLAADGERLRRRQIRS